MSKPSAARRILPALAVVLAALALPLYYPWVIASAKLELGGSLPDKAILGSVENVRLRAAEQYCTGVVPAGDTLWLVSRLERDGDEHPPGNLRLEEIGRDTASPAEGSAGYSWPGSLRSTSYSRLQRLDQDGQFQQTASLDETFCLLASPSGRSLFAMTGLDRPQQDQSYQTQVYRSDDSGASWQRLERPFMNPAQSLAWNMRLHFHGDDEVWSVDQPAPPGWDSVDNQPATGLAYSADGGRTAQVIRHPTSLLVSLKDARKRAPIEANWGDYNGEHGRIETQFVQLSAEEAVYWVSQSFMYGPQGGPYLDTILYFSNRIRLQRLDSGWQITEVERTDGELLAELGQSPDGRIIGVLYNDDKQSRVAELDPQTLHWTTTGALPSPFSPFSSSTHLRDFRVGKNTLLAVVAAGHEVPHWLTPGSDDAAHISANAVYYSRNWGRSWKKLAIDGYLGVVGFHPEHDRVYWADGNWYNSDDLNIYQTNLR